MPELPEVEYATRVLRAAALGKSVRDVSVQHPSHRRRLPPRHVARLLAATVTHVERRGKHQVVRLSTGDTLLVHFRMTGDWLVDRAGSPAPRFARVIIELSDDTRVSLVDPRALSTVVLHASGTPPLPELGPDATDPSVSAATFGSALARRRVSIKAALLDQRVLAGVGNIYAAEALWLARIDPRAIASSLSRTRQARLLDAVRRVLAKAQETAERYWGAEREAAGEGARFEVYDREGLPCRRCGGRIRRIVQGGRSTYYCPTCQRR